MEIPENKWEVWKVFFAGWMAGVKHEARFKSEVEEETERWKAQIAFSEWLQGQEANTVGRPGL